WACGTDHTTRDRVLFGRVFAFIWSFFHLITCARFCHGTVLIYLIQFLCVRESCLFALNSSCLYESRADHAWGVLGTRLPLDRDAHGLDIRVVESLTIRPLSGMSQIDHGKAANSRHRRCSGRFWLSTSAHRR